MTQIKVWPSGIDEEIINKAIKKGGVPVVIRSGTMGHYWTGDDWVENASQAALFHPCMAVYDHAGFPEHLRLRTYIDSIEDVEGEEE
jgi:hypothetical protein